MWWGQASCLPAPAGRWQGTQQDSAPCLAPLHRPPCRPHKGTRLRPYWEFSHHWIGRSAAVLAIVNVYWCAHTHAVGRGLGRGRAGPRAGGTRACVPILLLLLPACQHQLSKPLSSSCAMLCAGASSGCCTWGPGRWLPTHASWASLLLWEWRWMHASYGCGGQAAASGDRRVPAVSASRRSPCCRLKHLRVTAATAMADKASQRGAAARWGTPPSDELAARVAGAGELVLATF